jgi:membrane protease YdiL (CAAX protease family)
MLINPFFEELIVRGYLMTEVKYLTRSSLIAIVVSTVLQTSYHLYQGVPLALSEGMMFLTYSIFYAKTNRIGPVVMAHLLADVFAILGHWLMSRLLNNVPL